MPNQNKFQKGISTPIGILIIVVFAVVALGIIVWQSQMTKFESQSTTSAPVIQQPATNQPSTIPPANKNESWQVYLNTKLGFEIKYPTDWTYAIQNDGPDFFSEFLFLKKGNENIAKSTNLALEMGSVSEYLELNSLIMEAKNYKGFSPKKYMTKGLGKYREEIVKWEEKTTIQGKPVYFYTIKIKDKSVDEVKEGVLFVNNKTRKITIIERVYRMDGSKISDNLRKILQEIALSFVDTQK